MRSDGYVLGVDYGAKRIGLALAHTIARLPRPLATLASQDMPANVQAIAGIVAKEGVVQVVVGLPYGLDGTVTPQTAVIRDFVAALAAGLAVPVITTDETLSSVEAEARLQTTKNAGSAGLDAEAAAIILERYFDETAWAGPNRGQEVQP